MKEILHKTVEVENDLVVITEEIKTKKDRRQLENEILGVQRQMANIAEQNKRMLEEYERLQSEEQFLRDMLAQLPQDKLQIIG